MTRLSELVADVPTAVLLLLKQNEQQQQKNGGRERVKYGLLTDYSPITHRLLTVYSPITQSVGSSSRWLNGYAAPTFVIRYRAELEYPPTPRNLRDRFDKKVSALPAESSKIERKWRKNRQGPTKSMYPS